MFKNVEKGKTLQSGDQRKFDEDLMNAHELQRLLKCSLPLIYKMAERGQIPCVRWECPGEGGKKPRFMVRFKRQDVFNFIESHYQTN